MAIRQRVSRTVALLRYHRPSQFTWRFYRIAQRKLRAFLPEHIVYRPGNEIAQWKMGGKAAMERIAVRRASLWPSDRFNVTGMAEGRFRFLNIERDLNLEGGLSQTGLNWNPEASRLWRFHLQCQEYLLELAVRNGAADAFRVVASWLSEDRHQTPTRDPDAWHPFCISRRLPVWLSLAAMHDPPGAIREEFWRSIANQVRWLRRNCEWDLGGNHLLENLTALFLADSFLDLGSDSGVAGLTERLLLSQLNEQILPSGEHFERTPTYHGLMTACVLQCAEAAGFGGSSAQQSFTEFAARMCHVANWIRQPDGSIPLFADSSFEETPDFDQLSDWAGVCANDSNLKEPRLDYWASAESGNDRLLMDIGPLACDQLPAHGHADLFQIVASIDGHQAIVDTGNFEYEPTELRQRCRGSASHNVLQIEDQDHCDLWSSFRMGHRGHPVWRTQGEIGDFHWCAASHDAYRCPAGRIVFARQHSWIIIDWYVDFHREASATTRLHWHPDWQLVRTGSANRFNVSRSQSPRSVYVVSCLGSGNETLIDDGLYCPNFGERHSNKVLVNRGTSASRNWLGFQIHLDASSEGSIPRGELLGRELLVTLPDSDGLRLSLVDGCVS